MAVDDVQKAIAAGSGMDKLKQFAQNFKMDDKFLEKFPAALQKEGEEKKLGTSGLTKLLVKSGEGWSIPRPGDEVEVHYIGMFADGKQFDSSYQRNETFKFKLGQGEVIRGWDQGVASMRKTEKSIFTIPAIMAYGDVGAPPLVPPNATLKFEIELVSWASVTDVLKDGGIVKKTIVEGKNWETPKEADEVTVVMEAKLENDSIVEKTTDEGVTFQIRDGYFCPAVGYAIKTMKAEEEALLTVTSQYGFAERGRKGEGATCSIPPYQNLIIKVKLLSWRVVEDITDDRGIIKKILKQGEGQKASEGALVKVKYQGKLSNGRVFESKGYGDGDELFEFRVDEEEVVDGLDRGIATMRKGEISEIVVSSEYGYGDDIETQSSLAIVPAKSQLTYVVEMVSFEKEKGLWEMTEEEKLEAASRRKEEGNEKFKMGKYWRASKKYEKAVKYIEYDVKFSDEEKIRSKNLKIACYLNNAACKLKLKSYADTAKLCSKVLDSEPNNVKALYRRAQSYLENCDLDVAEKDILGILNLQPYNKEAKVLQQELKKKRADYDKRTAKLYSHMVDQLKL